MSRIGFLFCGNELCFVGFIFVYFFLSLFFFFWVCWNRAIIAIMEMGIAFVWIFFFIAWVLVFVVAGSDFLICWVFELFLFGEQSATATSSLDAATLN